MSVFDPPIIMIVLGPEGPEGSGTASPHSRRTEKFGVSCQVQVVVSSIAESEPCGPRARTFPEGVTNRCG